MNQSKIYTPLSEVRLVEDTRGGARRYKVQQRESDGKWYIFDDRGQELDGPFDSEQEAKSQAQEFMYSRPPSGRGTAGLGHKWVNGVAVPDSGPGVQGYEDAVQGKRSSSSDPDYLEGYNQGQRASKESSTFYRSSGDMMTGRTGRDTMGGKDDPVGEKIKKLMDEGKDQDQAVAEALSMERQGTLGRGTTGGAESAWDRGYQDGQEGKPKSPPDWIESSKDKRDYEDGYKEGKKDGSGAGRGSEPYDDNWIPGTKEPSGGIDQEIMHVLYQGLQRAGIDTENCSFTTQGALLVQQVDEGRITVDQAVRKIASDQGRYLTYGSYGRGRSIAVEDIRRGIDIDVGTGGYKTVENVKAEGVGSGKIRVNFTDGSGYTLDLGQVVNMR